MHKYLKRTKNRKLKYDLEDQQWIDLINLCIVANNMEHIPVKELNEFLEIIQAQYFMICAEWKRYFREEEISFYC